MRFHQVEVDDEVFQFVKRHAEPLEDNFNSALRRLLPLKGPNVRKTSFKLEANTKKNGSIPSIPSGTPQALRQILEVVHLVRSGAYSRRAATRFVAKEHNVVPQTVIDKYGRQLDMTANRFDRLLEQPDLADLRELLKSKFPEYRDVVEQFLS
jgi:hypothetical protein